MCEATVENSSMPGKFSSKPPTSCRNSIVVVNSIFVPNTVGCFLIGKLFDTWNYGKNRALFCYRFGIEKLFSQNINLIYL